MKLFLFLGANTPSMLTHPTFIGKLDSDISGICSSIQVLLAWTSSPDVEMLMIEEKMPFVLDPSEETLRILDQLLAEVWDGLDGRRDWPPPKQVCLPFFSNVCLYIFYWIYLHFFLIGARMYCCGMLEFVKTSIPFHCPT